MVEILSAKLNKKLKAIANTIAKAYFAMVLFQTFDSMDKILNA